MSYKKYLELPETEKQELFEILTEQEKLDPSHGFICPTMECHLYVPCELKDCEHHIKNSWFRNCALYYMSKENVQQLSPTEVAFLFKIPEEEVTELYNNQMYKIRKRYLKENLITKNKITYLANTGICCVCECKTNSSIKKDGLIYCGTKCAKTKPPYIFDIEREFGSDIRTILLSAMEMFKSIEVLESVFCINRKRIEFIVHNFVPEMSDHFITLLNSNDDFLNRKERKSNICIQILKRMSIQRRQFGSPKVSIEPEYLKFYEKLQLI